MATFNETPIPNLIIDYWISRLTPAEFSILMCIAHNAFRLGSQQITKEKILQITDMSNRTFQRHAKSSIAVGAIKENITDKDRSKNIYQLGDVPNEVLDED